MNRSFSLISSFLVSDVSESLILLKSNERFAQVAERKWAIVSKSLRSLTKNEQMSELLVLLSESLIRSFLGKKRSDSLGKPMSEFPGLSFISENLKW